MVKAILTLPDISPLQFCLPFWRLLFVRLKNRASQWTIRCETEIVSAIEKQREAGPRISLPAFELGGHKRIFPAARGHSLEIFRRIREPSFEYAQHPSRPQSFDD